MSEMKKFIDDLGIEAFETNLKLAGLAIVSDSGEIIIQTENWNLIGQTNTIINVLKGEKSFELSGGKFSVIETSANGIVATSDTGMGYVLFAPFQGGTLLAYAMPQADTSMALSFLKTNTLKLIGKI